jgi:hypothetical protein
MVQSTAVELKFPVDDVEVVVYVAANKVVSFVSFNGEFVIVFVESNI